jgi:hypothetical protein
MLIGPTLLEIDHDVLPEMRQDVHGPESKLIVFDTGAWTLTSTDTDGKSLAQRAGCLDTPTLDAIRGDLARETWTSYVRKIACAAVGSHVDRYIVRGKEMWTSRECQAAYLDYASRQILSDLTTRLAVATRPPATPPCCKK